MRDMTVLRQTAAHLDGWSDLRAQAMTGDDGWPGVHIARITAGTGAELWQCVHDHWTGQLFADGTTGEPVATIQTTIAEAASASEVADGIKTIYRLLRTAHEPG
jgi:hypothetical protein